MAATNVIIAEDRPSPHLPVSGNRAACDGRTDPELQSDVRILHAQAPGVLNEHKRVVRHQHSLSAVNSKLTCPPLRSLLAHLPGPLLALVLDGIGGTERS